MPMYDYINAAGDRVERFFNIGKAPDEIEIDGEAYWMDLTANIMSAGTSVKSWNGVGRAPCGTWPRTSQAMGVADSQVPEMMEYDRKHGVPTDYTKDGDPILTSKGHEKSYMKLHGFEHRGRTRDRKK